jgi:hypothetical protein
MRQRPIRLIAALVSLSLALSLSACSDDDDVPQSRGEMINQIAAELSAEDEIGLEGDEARCVAEAIVDEIGFERLRSELEDAGGTFDDIDNDELAGEVGLAMFGAMLDCVDDPSGFFQE